ncbi:MAG: NfeD family protein [Oscillospiraceae bacterium]|jgi:membrane protein implicated in regulation of membrane protease activity|nr:NfeD family protein [Oscillospiraceae bacterium]
MAAVAIVWLVAAILLVVLEAFSVQLVSIWFAVGALVAMIFALLALPVWLQLIAFTLVSVALLAATRPLARKIAVRHKTATNLDRAIGEIAIVLRDIGGGQVGEVKVNGLIWSAVPIADFVIRAGETAKVIAIEGVKLVVDKISTEVSTI